MIVFFRNKVKLFCLMILLIYWNNTDQERIVLIFDFDRPMKNIGRYIHNTSMRIFICEQRLIGWVKSTLEIKNHLMCHTDN